MSLWRIFVLLQTAEKTKADTSTAATLDYLIAMRLKAALDNSNATTQQAQEPTGPPPINVAEFSFYAYIEGKQQGPYNEKQFANLVQYGLVDAMTFVWTEGMPQWQRAGMVEGTRKFFPQTGNITPPPPPIDLD